MQLPASASGAKAMELKYDLLLEYDKNLRIGEMPTQAVEQMKKDFDSQMMKRNMR